MLYNKEQSYAINGAAMHVYNVLGYGFLMKEKRNSRYTMREKQCVKLTGPTLYAITTSLSN